MSACTRNTFITRRDRETGCKLRAGDIARSNLSLSSNIKAHHTWDPRKTISDTDHGGIFNFDFSKDGSILGAACERKSVLLFDPFNGKKVATKLNAHTDCVNCVKFLDDRLFATCSDDTTVALWDTRYLKHNVQTFRGHSNWVKNIEYDSKQGILLTSGFDGCIYTWNINRYSTEESSNKVFYTSGLMRSKLSPDFSKLIISTHEGYIIVVHNLDLSTLGEDLKGFKPNMYRLMQRSQTPLRIGLMYNHVFEQERNRVQFIADWPTGNDANIISSLQVHPQGWCMLSRNTDSSENTEWTCVHELLDDYPEKKAAKRPWEMERVTPHTSSAYCTSTNTPAYSSLAPSNQSRTRNSSSSENPSENAMNQSSSNNISGNSSTRELAGNSSNQALRSSQARQLPGNQGSRGSADTNSSIDRPASRDSISPDSNDGIFTPAPVEITRGSQNETNASPPERRAATSPQVSGPIHNSLIQIRRGARQEDGSFSFSISVHTSSGRTIEFNQDDLASDDEESGVRIERIIPNNNADLPHVNLSSGNTTRSIGDNRSEQQGNSASGATSGRDVSPNERTRTETATDQTQDEDTSTNVIGESATVEEVLSVQSVTNNDHSVGPESDSDSDYDHNLPGSLIDHTIDDYSDLENESDHDLIEEDRYEFSNDSDDEAGAVGSSFDIAYTNEETGGEINLTIQDSGGATANVESDRLFRNSGLPRIRRAGSSRSIRANSSNSRSSNTSSSGYSSSVNTNAQNSSPQIANSLDSHSRNNSFMFVLESNTGNRRRRILNLSYLDSYSEVENNQLQKNIHWNRKKLLGYTEECNVGRGFIKEVGFSHDGRLISSPFGFGLRIFAFDSLCNELCDCIPSSPVKLYEVTCSLAHVNCVVATKFSPVHNLIVSGCLDGKIAFHQPVL
ncbi:LOW QUALITY PROTEIN: uncharacterized protein LOC132743126 [Ruditapes philippinarum]|uniref:LOW QUALITY PROTEIN: uncharacterized protein LOC132743126 n=1 Tax=Ruditapes philippinarum TaxID=129788 RepID=UPI00295AB834|nr:LOW QUALITY PROTEIN: uncharacterized protein LOC132743126 [Ruditapes philippinarum]